MSVNTEDAGRSRTPHTRHDKTRWSTKPGKIAVAGGTVPQGNRRPAHERSSDADGTVNIVRRHGYCIEIDRTRAVMKESSDDRNPQNAINDHSAFIGR